MDNRQSQNSSRAQRRGPNPRSVGSGNISQPQTQEDAYLLDQHSGSATGTGQQHQSHDDQLPQNAYPSIALDPNFYSNFTSYPWSSLPTQQPLHPLQAVSSHYPQSPSVNTSALPFVGPISSTDATGMSTERQQQPPSQASAAGGSTSAGSSVIPPDVEQPIAEEKRRRNTAASARFRIKKKHKTITLERTICDLTGRAEGLEREASDLRRENGWLKEIVMLKSARYAANNPAHQEALRNAAAMASGQVLFGESSAGGLGTQDGYTDEPEEESDNEDTDEHPSNKDTKGKGPAKGGKQM